MHRLSAVALAALLFFGVLTVWIPHRWPVHALQAGVFILCIPWAAVITLRARPPRGSLVLIPLGGAVLWGLLQLLFGWTVYRFETWNAVLTWTTHLAVFWLALQIFALPENRLWSRRALLYFGFALSVLSTVQYFTTPGRIFGIFAVDYANVGPFLNRDHYSTFVELPRPLALFEALRERRRTLPHALMAGALFASVIAGASRAGSILVTLEILVVLFLGLSPRFAPAGRLGRAISWTALFAVVFVAVVGWEVLWRRFQDPDPYRGPPCSRWSSSLWSAGRCSGAGSRIRTPTVAAASCSSPPSPCSATALGPASASALGQRPTPPMRCLTPATSPTTPTTTGLSGPPRAACRSS